VIGSRRMRRAGHVKCMIRECIKILVEKKLKRMDDLKEPNICGRVICGRLICGRLICRRII
jgi:hypothetical protein